MLTSLDKLCIEATKSGVVPGIVVAARVGQRRVLAAHGLTQTGPHAVFVTPQTVYDLASLTKALCTSLLVMQQVTAGQWTLHQTLETLWPGGPFGPDVGAATLAQLLSHSAGLAAHARFYKDAVSASEAKGQGPTPAAGDALVAAAGAMPLTYTPGTQSVYSDLGFILLGALLQQHTATPLERLFQTRIAGPLGLNRNDIGFRPLHPAPLPCDDIIHVAATEDCPWRGRVIHGDVHDQNTWAMGGVAGHAGLFGHVTAVQAVADGLCKIYNDRGNDDLPDAVVQISPRILKRFFAPAGVPESTWRLGWDGPALRGPSLAGHIIARHAVGHLGFTGCSLWMDPGAQSYVITLSNRIHPDAGPNPGFVELRPRINDQALSQLGYTASAGEHSV